VERKKRKTDYIVALLCGGEGSAPDTAAGEKAEKIQATGGEDGAKGANVNGVRYHRPSRQRGEKGRRRHEGAIGGCKKERCAAEEIRT